MDGGLGTRHLDFLTRAVDSGAGVAGLDVVYPARFLHTPTPDGIGRACCLYQRCSHFCGADWRTSHFRLFCRPCGHCFHRADILRRSLTGNNLHADCGDGAGAWRCISGRWARWGVRLVPGCHQPLFDHLCAGDVQLRRGAEFRYQPGLWNDPRRFLAVDTDHSLHPETFA